MPNGYFRICRKQFSFVLKHNLYLLSQLISDAIRYGDCHRTTMEMADFWLLEKQLVHKLFKVFVPRFENCKVSYTRMYKAPREYPGQYYKRAVLELRGNPYPTLQPDMTSNRNLIHNVLLDEARKAYRKEKYAEISAKLVSTDEPPATTKITQDNDSDRPLPAT